MNKKENSTKNEKRNSCSKKQAETKDCSCTKSNNSANTRSRQSEER